MAVGGTVFVLNVLAGNYGRRDLTRGPLAVLALFAALLLLHLLVPGGKTHTRSLKYFLLFPGMVMACVFFAARRHTLRDRTLYRLVAGVLCLCITIQTIGFWHHQPKDLYGFYGTQKHHLGLFASLALPLLCWLMFSLTDRFRFALAPWAAASLFLLWQSHSRVSWIVFFPSVLLASLVFLNRRHFLGLLSATTALSALTAWWSGAAGIGARLNELIANFAQEDRWSIWRETWEALQRSTAGEWLLGHGIGSFAFDENVHISPHNAVLQLLFENGILGAVLVGVGIVALMAGLLRAARRRPKVADRYLVWCLFTLLCIDVGHCLLTKSIYSKYIMYTMSLIVGTSLAIIDKPSEEPADWKRKARSCS
jgi:O-antigen ligase